MGATGPRRHIRRLAAALLLAATLGPLAAAADSGPGVAPEPGADAWLLRMVSALRTSGTLAAHIRADTVDYLGGKSEVTIELIRDTRQPTMQTVVEVREKGVDAPVLFRLDSAPDGTVTSWAWDIRFQAFVHVMDLVGPEPFAGTHFRLEDLGYTGLLTRRGGTAMRDGDEVRVTSGPYESYGRVVSHLDPATGLPRRTEIYDVTGALIWKISYDQVRVVGGQPVPTLMTARNPVSREQTVLTWDKVVVGLPVPPEVFNLQRLRVAMRHGDDPVVMPGEEAKPKRAASSATPKPAAAPGHGSAG